MNLPQVAERVRAKLANWVKTSKQRIMALGIISFAYFFVFSVTVVHGAGPLLTGATTAVIGTFKWYLWFIGISAAALAGLSMLTFVSGVLFDLSLSWTILDAGEILSANGSLMSGLREIWVIFRDMANILIIGMFVYIALNKILGTKQDFKKMIVSLLSVAVLINFSFFFAQVTIDISNWFAVQTYNAITPDGVTPRFSLTSTSDTAGYSISESFMSIAQVKEWSSLAGTTILNGATAPIQNIFFIVSTGLLLMVMFILFLRMAFILLSRWLILMILMATSSLAFATMLFPKLDKYWKYWRDGLIYNAVVGPLLLIMLYVVSIIGKAILAEFPNKLNINQSFFTSLSWNDIGISLTSSILFIALLWAAISIATMLSHTATESAGGLGRFVSSALGKVEGLGYAGLSGGLGWAGRNTYGAGFSSMGKYFEGRANNASSARMGQLYSGLSKMAKTQGDRGLDPRGTKFAQDFGKSAGVSMGKANTEGFQKLADRREKEQKERQKKQQATVEASQEGTVAIENELRKSRQENKDNTTKQKADMLANTKAQKELAAANNKSAADVKTSKDALDKEEGELEIVRADRKKAEKAYAETEGQGQDLQREVAEQTAIIEKITDEAKLKEAQSHLAGLKSKRDKASVNHAANEKALTEATETFNKLDAKFQENSGEYKEMQKSHDENVETLGRLEGNAKTLKDRGTALLHEKVAIAQQLTAVQKELTATAEGLNMVKQYTALSDQESTKLASLQATDIRHLSTSDRTALEGLLKRKADRGVSIASAIANMRKGARERSKDKDDYDAFQKYAKYQEAKEAGTSNTQQSNLRQEGQKTAADTAAGAGPVAK